MDASCLGPEITGTQVQVLELLRAIRERSDQPLRVVVPRRVGAEAWAVLDGLDLRTIHWDDVSPRTSRDDVVHRPYQVAGARDLSTLLHLGRRLVVTQQDLIAYGAGDYFASRTEWDEYRWATRAALSLASRVVCFSHHVADAAVAAALVAPERVSVVHPGTDHQPIGASVVARAPAALGDGRASPFLLCLGADYLHKNRVFALQLQHAMQRRGGHPRTLVFAGPTVAHGSSLPLEQAYLQSHPDVARSLVRLGPVTESEKWWLLAQADAVLYPTVEEGFGFIPFEAAAAGTPCLCAPRSSLAEILPPEAAVLPLDNPETAAATADEVLRDAATQRRLVERVRAAGRQFTWQKAADGVLDVWAAVMTEAPVDLAAVLSAADLARVGPAGLLPTGIRTRLASSRVPSSLRPALARALLDARGMVKMVSNRVGARRG